MVVLLFIGWRCSSRQRLWGFTPSFTDLIKETLQQQTNYTTVEPSRNSTYWSYFYNFDRYVRKMVVASSASSIWLLHWLIGERPSRRVPVGTGERPSKKMSISATAANVNQQLHLWSRDISRRFPYIPPVVQRSSFQFQLLLARVPYCYCTLNLKLSDCFLSQDSRK